MIRHALKDVVWLLEGDFGRVEVRMSDKTEYDGEDGRCKTIGKHQARKHGVGLRLERYVFLRVAVKRKSALKW